MWAPAEVLPPTPLATHPPPRNEQNQGRSSSCILVHSAEEQCSGNASKSCLGCPNTACKKETSSTAQEVNTAEPCTLLLVMQHLWLHEITQEKKGSRINHPLLLLTFFPISILLFLFLPNLWVECIFQYTSCFMSSPVSLFYQSVLA